MKIDHLGGRGLLLKSGMSKSIHAKPDSTLGTALQLYPSAPRAPEAPSKTDNMAIFLTFSSPASNVLLHTGCSLGIEHALSGSYGAQLVKSTDEVVTTNPTVLSLWASPRLAGHRESARG